MGRELTIGVATVDHGGVGQLAHQKGKVDQHIGLKNLDHGFLEDFLLSVGNQPYVSLVTSQE